MRNRHLILACAAALLFASGAADAQRRGGYVQDTPSALPQTRAGSYEIVTAKPGHGGGTIAFVDIGGSRIVEIDRGGRVVWEWIVPSSVLGGADLGGGADLEWIEADDSFLLVVPFRGIFRVGRSGAVLWRHLTDKVSHDADLLPDGNVIHVWGWDADGDATVVEVDPGGQVVWSWRARGRIDASWRDMRRTEQRYSFTHANAVQRLPNGDTLVSLRNMHRVVVVAPDGTVKRVWGPIRGVHEPRLLPNGTLIAARHAPQPNVVIAAKGQDRRVLFSNPIDLQPIRTVQPLQGGHLLLTGGDAIVEVDERGEIVWRALIYPGLAESRMTAGVYKAVHIPR